MNDKGRKLPNVDKFAGLSQKAVTLAAHLGDEEAIRLAGYKVPDRELWLWVQDLEMWGKEAAVRAAIACAEETLPRFEEKVRGNDHPRNCLEAAKSWLADPSEANRIRCLELATSGRQGLRSPAESLPAVSAAHAAGIEGNFIGPVCMAAASSALDKSVARRVIKEALMAWLLKSESFQA